MRHHASITSLPQSPEQERASRMIKYAVAMSVRIVCLFLCFIVPGWWMLLPALAAVFLPYFAVIIANTQMAPTRTAVERPGSIVRIHTTPHR